MLKLKATIPFLLAVVFALIATFLIFNWMKPKTKPVPPKVASGVTGQQIVVAATDLAWGTKISGNMLKTAPLSKDYIPAGAFSDPAQVAGRVLVMTVKKDEPLIETQLAPKDVTAGGVSAVVAPGMRAIAVAGDKVIGLSGLVLPGNYVDVLVTVQDPQDNKLHYTKTVLENVLVLATGVQLEDKGDGNKPQPVDVFTVEVTPEQAEVLSLAAMQGRLHFALRNPLDKATVLTLGETVPDMLNSFRPRLQKVTEPAAGMAPPRVAPARTAPRHVYEMQVINGTNVRHVSF